MNFLTFQKTFGRWPLVSVAEVEKSFPGFDRNALTRWQKAGFIEKVRNGHYRFSEQPIQSDEALFFIANRIYTPSYVSLQSALGWHGFIPEGVFTITSVTTLKTQTFKTSVGRFSWSHLKPALFFGYRFENFGDFRYKLADPAKALLDLIYLKPALSDAASFHELRLNYFEIREKFSVTDFEQYLSIFDSGALANRAKSLLKFLSEHDAIV